MTDRLIISARPFDWLIYDWLVACCCALVFHVAPGAGDRITQLATSFDNVLDLNSSYLIAGVSFLVSKSIVKQKE